MWHGGGCIDSFFGYCCWLFTCLIRSQSTCRRPIYCFLCCSCSLAFNCRLRSNLPDPCWPAPYHVLVSLQERMSIIQWPTLHFLSVNGSIANMAAPTMLYCFLPDLQFSLLDLQISSSATFMQLFFPGGSPAALTALLVYAYLFYILFFSIMLSYLILLPSVQHPLPPRAICTFPWFHYAWFHLSDNTTFPLSSLMWHPQMQLYPWMYDRVADHNSSPFPRFCTIQITPFSPVRAPQACHCLLTLTPNSPFFGTCPSSSSLSLDFDFDNVVTCFGMEGMFSYWHCVIAASSSRLEIPTAN